MSKKILAFIILITSSIFLPFWVTAALFVISVFYFENFYLGILAMFMFDVLYGFESKEAFGGIGFVFLGSVVVFIIANLVKKFITFNK
ncbi:MAG: hypothetical protein R3B39_01465 [Candidatus Paceibacterota bacterium]